MRVVLTTAVLALLLACLPAGAQDFPPRRPGLWQMIMTTTIQGNTSQPAFSEHCIDAATDRAMRALEFGMRQAKCEQQNLHREGNTLVLDADCKAGEQPIKAHGISTGSFEADYRTVLTITRIGTPPFPTIPPEMTITTSARWLGACKADQIPGDMVLPDGSRMNVRSIPGMPAQLAAQTPTAPATPASPAPDELKDLPARKPGLWEIHNVFDAGVLPAQTDKICVDAESDREMRAIASNAPNETCTQAVERQGDTHILTGRCSGPDGLTVSRAVITGDFQGDHGARITVTREIGKPAPGLPTEIRITQTSRWLSACPATMRGGDIMSANGTIRNFRDMRMRGATR